jgi:threonine dehydrogenase-like Zn-dependent dehydrogenase
MQEVRAGRLDPAPLISHRLPLADAAEGYALFDRREATKVLLLP